MEEVISNILPDLKECVQDLCIVLKTLGVITVEDLPLVQVEDLTSVISVIQARKLVRAWSVSGEFELRSIYS